jgi:23S rRNA (adenine2503-C2)-methyltransferase
MKAETLDNCKIEHSFENTLENPLENTLCGLCLKDLILRLHPLPRFRAAQIFKRVSLGASSFDEMTDLPKNLREELKSNFFLRPPIASKKTLKDKDALKIIMQFSGQKALQAASAQAVLLTDGKGRLTACLSTQAGCPASCVFCKTGLNFYRNLSSSEIMEQFLQLTNAAKEMEKSISNIVIMGMGEPLLNLQNLCSFFSVITDKSGFALSPRRITVSTCGITDGIISLAENAPPVRLALSLAAASEPLRGLLMPITKNYPLVDVKKALMYFQKKTKHRITLEVVLLKGINTRKEDALSLSDFAVNLDTVVNLIPWNKVPGLKFQNIPLSPPSEAEIEAFSLALTKRGLNVTRRLRKGSKVLGACGQLGQ